MQRLRLLFYYFFAALIIVTIAGLATVGMIEKTDVAFAKKVLNSWSLTLLLLVIAFTHTQVSKRNLTKLRTQTDKEDLFDKYTQYYQKKLVLNLIPVILTAILFVLTFKNLFFYILISQLLFAFVFFPRQSQILKELPDEDIEFI